MLNSVIKYLGMDFQGFVNTFSSSCAVLSVEKGIKGHSGKIRIVKANDFYKETMGVARYHDGMIYSDLVPQNLNFEDFCYRCVFEKKKLHSYIETRYLRCWSEITLLPLEGGDDSLGYCAFFIDFTNTMDPQRMATVPPDIASSIIKSCVSLHGGDDFNMSIKYVVSEILERTDSFCCCIILIDTQKQDYEILCEKFRGNLDFDATVSGIVPYSIVETWEDTIAGSNSLIIKDEQDMQALEKKNPAWANSLRASYARNLILYPLVQEKQVFGYLFVTNFNEKKAIESRQLIELTTFFLSAEIYSHILMKKLERISTTDLLTGLKNRTAMNERVDMFTRKEKLINPPFGVVFATMNGLKQVNAAHGHNFGDKLIKSAAQIISEVFSGAEIYRSSGDEFMIIMPACSKEEFEEKISLLKQKNSVSAEVSLAIGAHWNENGENLRQSMHIAGEAMRKELENSHP